MQSHHALVLINQTFRPGPYPLDLNSMQIFALEQPTEGSSMAIGAQPSG
jgi:hypothetical protein